VGQSKSWHLVADRHIPHDTVGALAQLLCDIVPRINDELLPKHLEASASADFGHVCVVKLVGIVVEDSA
jgi:hypothetical protein